MYEGKDKIIHVRHNGAKKYIVTVAQVLRSRCGAYFTDRSVEYAS